MNLYHLIINNNIVTSHKQVTEKFLRNDHNYDLHLSMIDSIGYTIHNNNPNSITIDMEFKRTNKTYEDLVHNLHKSIIIRRNFRLKRLLKDDQ